MEDYSPAAAIAAAYRGRAAYLHDYLAAPPHHPALPLEFTYLGRPSSSTSSGDMPDTNNRRDAAAGGADDLRQRRMIKHRASAERSRARARQDAYTKELERELAQLRRDNHMLIKRQQDLLHARLAVPAAHVVRRCRSAPPAP